MAALLTTLFVALSHLSPADALPELAPYRPVMWVSVLAVIASLITIALHSYPFGARQNLLLLGFFLVVLVSPIVHGWFGGTLVALASFAPAAAAFFVCAATIRTTRHLRLLSVSLVLVAIYMAISGLIAYQSGFGRSLFINEWPPITEQVPGQPVVKRICGLGFLRDPNDFSQFLLILLPLIWTAWRNKSILRNIVLVVAPSLLFGIALIRAQSRGAFLGLAAMAVFLVRKRLGTTLSMVLALVLLTVVFAGGVLTRNTLSVHEDSAAGRVEAWGNGIAMWKSNPLFGVGYGQFGNMNEDQSGLTAHNSFVLCFAELGIIGYLVWLALIASTILDLNALLDRLSSRDSFDVVLRRWAVALRLSLIGYLATAWFLSRTYVVTLYVLLGMCVGLIWIANRQSGPVIRTDLRRAFSWAVLTALCSIALLYGTLRMRVV